MDQRCSRQFLGTHSRRATNTSTCTSLKSKTSARYLFLNLSDYDLESVKTLHDILEVAVEDSDAGSELVRIGNLFVGLKELENCILGASPLLPSALREESCEGGENERVSEDPKPR